MELNAEQNVKGLECCHSHDYKNCPKCPYNKDTEKACFMILMEDALSLIKELLEDNEAQAETITSLIETIKSIQADTVRKMQEMLKPIFVDKSYTLYTGACVHDTIDQIAKEMLEGEK